ncbi:MAG: polysaccharide deacetylase family protein [Leptolyngbya sp. SIO4C1]|nr:polysaccharide deacetylase family protein [Leptolyngbya sp. SIO4C1]
MKIVGVAIAIAILTLTLLWQPRWALRLAAWAKPGALYFVPTEQQRVALTIDDGPHPQTTDQILAVLAQHDAQATFFIIRDHLASNEAALSKMVTAGHELGNHMTADAPSIRLSAAEFEADLLAAEAALIDYAKPRWLRPGMGWYSAEMVDIAAKHGYRLALGSVFPYDTHIPSAQFAAWFILTKVQPGDVIVLHDGSRDRGQRTVEVLQQILPALEQRGYAVVGVEEMVRGARTEESGSKD